MSTTKETGLLEQEKSRETEQPHSSPPPPKAILDIEKQQPAQKEEDQMKAKRSVYEGLGWLDRLLVLWILLAIIIGILLGNFVDGVGPALQKGKFVDVSVPIGT